MSERPPPSMARRLLWVSGLGAALMAVAVALAAVAAVHEEVDELLDDALRASAEQLAPMLLVSDAAPARAEPQAGEQRFAWAWFDSAGRLVRASALGEAGWARRVQPGQLADSEDWRLYAHALPAQRGLLVVAQTRSERQEASLEVSEFALLAALAVLLLSLPLLAWRVHQELRPLQQLAERLQGFDAKTQEPGALTAQLGAPLRSELRPMHEALDGISQRLGERLDFEREFSAQAAHLLRTPLAGMDAQLAVALKESPGQPRLQRVREAAQRLQHVVVALLRLFRSGTPLQRQTVDARQLLAQLPLGSLQLAEGPPCPLQADAELLAAALLNLIDNAQRHGARQLWLTQPAAQVLTLRDDGSGLPGDERAALEQRLLLPGRAGEGGLGLRLALRVAQAHGGTLSLPPCESGFSVRLALGD